MDYGQRYLVTVSYEHVARDGSKPDGPKTMSGTMWAKNPDEAKAKMERWAKLEFRRAGFAVISHATEAKLAG